MRSFLLLNDRKKSYHHCLEHEFSLFSVLEVSNSRSNIDNSFASGHRRARHHANSLGEFDASIPYLGHV